MKPGLMKTTLLSGIAIAMQQGYVATAQENAEPNQAAETDEGKVLETVVIQGIRKSIADSIGTKRNSGQVVDAITSEDIGKLPDVNVSESLQRITGVQIERSFGEGANILVRGLDQNLTLFNGRNIPPIRGTGDVGLEVFPSQLFGGLEVYKTPTASQIEGALGATINLRTRRAFDFTEPTVSYIGQGVYTDLAEETGYNASVLATKRFMNDTLGVLFVASLNERQLREDKFQTAGYESAGDVDGDGDDDFKPDRLQFIIDDRERQKIGLSTSIEWRPDSNLNAYFDGTYVQLKDDGPRSLARFVTGNDVVPGTDLVVSENNTILTATLTSGGASQYRGDGANEPQELEQILLAAGGDYTVGDWNFSGELSYAENSSFLGLEQFFLSAAGTQLTYDFGNTDIPSFALDIDVTDPDTFGSPLFQLFEINNSREEVATRFDLEYSWDSENSTEFGMRYRTTDQSQTDMRNANRSIFNVDYGLSSDGDGNTVLGLNGQTNIFDGVSGNFPRRFITSPLDGTDISNITDLSQVPGFSLAPGEISPVELVLIPGSSYDLSEDVFAAYVQHNFSVDAAPFPISGNIGVRFVDTEITSNGFLTPAGYSRTNPNNYTDIDDGTTPRPLTGTQSYFRTLPSLNLRFELREDLVLRAGVAETIARPSLDQLRVGVTSGTPPSVAGEFGQASGGNPGLSPFEATQYDLSLEYYLNDSGLLSFAYFNKGLNGFIIDQVTEEVLPGFQAGFDQFLVTRPANGEDGSIEGFEIAYTQPFTFLPEPFDGFGVNTNYTYTSSEQDVQNPFGGEFLPLENLSENSYNLIAYYEKAGFGARLAYNWRDEYVDVTSGRGGLPIFVKERGQLDFSAFYDVNDKFSITFEAVNIGRDQVETYSGIEERLTDYSIFDRVFTFGIRGRF